MSIVEAQNDLAQHPWLRFGQRGMQAFDGFTQAVVANWEARGRAWDTVTQGGLIPLDKKASVDRIARMMDGFSGAEIKAVCTEAGYFAIRKNRYRVLEKDF